MNFNTLKAFGDTLKTVCENTQYCKAYGSGFPRIIYEETGVGYSQYDNQNMYPVWKVDVSLFTKKDFDPIVEELEQCLNENQIPFKLIGVGYGRIPADGNSPEFKGLHHYLFECEV